ncbi:hypothetical protein [Hyalangium gracile]|uniref:hypothetical protein n=1 Tax=Hyalangium gracile TaxID=394092 RepID=UPI001CCF687F|nr:hypothetical protein [Hyalangium gracile]
MKASTPQPSVQVQVVPSQFPRILERAGDDRTFRAQLERANVILVPEEDYRGADGPVFPPGTENFFRYLQDNQADSLTVDLAVRDEDYLELGLHGEELWIPTLVMIAGNQAQVSLLINLLSNYVYDWLKRGPSRKEGNVKAEVLLDGQKKTVSIKYEGPPGTFETAFSESLRAAFNEQSGGDSKAGSKKK